MNPVRITNDSSDGLESFCLLCFTLHFLIDPAINFLKLSTVWVNKFPIKNKIGEQVSEIRCRIAICENKLAWYDFFAFEISGKDLLRPNQLKKQQILKGAKDFLNLKFNCMAKNREMQDQDHRTNRGNTANRGFASMDPERQREIAREGGKAAHEKGTAHEFDSEEAREAGRKGGEVVSQNREHMAEIGRKGGQSSGGNRRQAGE